MSVDPCLFKIKIKNEHMSHLQNDDLDEISKFEVVYQILKDQLREHKQSLIQMKEEKQNALLIEKMKHYEKRRHSKQKMRIDELAKHVKPFKWIGS